MKYKIKIPTKLLKPLITLTEFSDQKRITLFQEFKKINIEPELSLKKEIKKISQKIDLPISKMEKIFDFMIGFYFNYDMSKDSKEDFIKDTVLPSIKSQFEELNIDELNDEKVISICEEILSLDVTIGIVAKIISLTGESSKSFLEARILSDLRFLFDKDVTSDPEYAIIQHNLKIRCLIDGKVKNEFITLTPEDLIELKNTIDRAIKKEKKLKELCLEKDFCLLSDIEWA